MLTLKTTLLALLGISASAMGGATAYAVYTPVQVSFPFNSALKVTPDPANIWSWHKVVSMATPVNVVTEQVLVDIDGNGVMDTNASNVRVLITEIQIVGLSSNLTHVSDAVVARILDSAGERWIVPPYLLTNADASHNPYVSLRTPLALANGSDLFVELTRTTTSNIDVHINLIGRVVNL